jgi:hypothetical protein
VAELGATDRNDKFRQLVQRVLDALHVAQMEGLKPAN